MAKAVYGEWSAYDTPGGIRFMKAGKLASEQALPPEVVAYLKSKLGDDSGKVEAKTESPKAEPQRFPRPSEEELARMRAESLQVKPELQMTPDEIIARTPIETVDSIEEPVSEADFDVFVPEVEPEPEQIVEPEPQLPVVDPDFLESVSIYTADIGDIAQALYDRFGVYTVYLKKLPEGDEVNPLTGVPFTKYHLGIAYQAAIYAQNQGILDREPAYQRRLLDQGREASANFQTDPVPYTMKDNRQANSFAFRTSVKGNQMTATTRVEHIMGDDGQLHAVQVPVQPNEFGEENLNGAGQRYSADDEEMIVEPPIAGGKPIIRPNW